MTHHLIAEHYGLQTGGIELGYKEGWDDSTQGLTHVADSLESKRTPEGLSLTPNEFRAYFHSLVSNGFGQEAVLQTPALKWGNISDLKKARTLLGEVVPALTDEQRDTFIGDSGLKTRELLRNAAIRYKLLVASETLARDHWANGLVDRTTVNKYLEGE